MKTTAKFQVTVKKNPNGKYDTTTELPMMSADAACAQDMAFHAQRSINAMLDFSKSDYRLVFYDTVKKEYVQVTEKK